MYENFHIEGLLRRFPDRHTEGDRPSLDNKDGEILWALLVDGPCKLKSRSGHLHPKAMDPSASLSRFKRNNPNLRKEDLLQSPYNPVLKERLVCALAP